MYGKNLHTDRLVLRDVQLRLLFNGIVLEDNRCLEFYNVNNHSNIVFVKRLSGGARTKRTVGLRKNENSQADLESFDESIDNDEKLGDCYHCGDSGMCSTNCDNDDCEDMGTLYM